MKINELHLKEYDKLQNEIAQILAEIGTLERFAVLASGGFFSWSLSFTGEKTGAFCLSYFIPVVLTLVFGFMAYGHFTRLQLIGTYIKTKYEPLLNPEQSETREYGWENYLENTLKGKGSFLAKSRVWMWFFLLLIDLAIGIYLMCCNCNQPALNRL